MHRSHSPARRRWLTRLLALPFLAVGIGMLCLMLLPTVYDWARMQRWEPVPAQLLAADLQTTRSSKGGSSYLATAHYRYQFAGQTYESTRVAISARSDNIGDFQQQLGRRLAAAQRRGETVSAWVNPQAPQQAVLDRSLRPALLAFQLGFGLVFAGIGAGLLYWGWRKPAAVAVATAPGTDEAPWLARREWADNAIRSDKRWELWVAWGFTLAWNLISMPLLFSELPRLLQNPKPGPMIAMIFPLIGVGLLIWAIRVSRDVARQGELRLSLDPFPGAIGGHVGGTLMLGRSHDASHAYRVTLSCLRHYRQRDSEGTESRESLAWQIEGFARTAYSSDGVRLGFRFSVPAGLPPSSEDDGEGNHHSWRLQIERQPPATSFSRRFEIPVFATGASARLLREDSSTNPAARAQREAEIEAVADIERGADGLHLYFPYGRNARNKLSWLVFGLIFGGSGGLTGWLGAPLLFPVVFGLIGALILIFSLWGLCNSLRVRVDRAGVLSERRLLGLPVGRRQAGRSEIRGLALKESYSTQHEGRHETIYRVVAELHDGRRITLAESLRGRDVAQQMLETVQQASGLPAGKADTP